MYMLMLTARTEGYPRRYTSGGLPITNDQVSVSL